MDSRETAQSRPWLAVGQEIDELLARIDADAFAKLVQAFDDPGRRWFFSGQGRSGLARRWPRCASCISAAPCISSARCRRRRSARAMRC